MIKVEHKRVELENITMPRKCEFFVSHELDDDAFIFFISDDSKNISGLKTCSYFYTFKETLPIFSYENTLLSCVKIKLSDHVLIHMNDKTVVVEEKNVYITQNKQIPYNKEEVTVYILCHTSKNKIETRYSIWVEKDKIEIYDQNEKRIMVI